MEGNKRFGWVDFYMELAGKLVPFSENREALVEKIKKIYLKIGISAGSYSYKTLPELSAEAWVAFIENDKKTKSAGQFGYIYSLNGSRTGQAISPKRNQLNPVEQYWAIVLNIEQQPFAAVMQRRALSIESWVKTCYILPAPLLCERKELKGRSFMIIVRVWRVRGI